MIEPTHFFECQDSQFGIIEENSVVTENNLRDAILHHQANILKLLLLNAGSIGESTQDRLLDYGSIRADKATFDVLSRAFPENLDTNFCKLLSQSIVWARDTGPTISMLSSSNHHLLDCQEDLFEVAERLGAPKEVLELFLATPSDNGSSDGDHSIEIQADIGEASDMVWWCV